MTECYSPEHLFRNQNINFPFQAYLLYHLLPTQLDDQ